MDEEDDKNLEKIKEFLKSAGKEEKLKTCPRCYYVLVNFPVYGITNCPNCKYYFEGC